jgi:hypothetical protein
MDKPHLVATLNNLEWEATPDGGVPAQVSNSYDPDQIGGELAIHLGVTTVMRPERIPQKVGSSEEFVGNFARNCG